MNKLKELLKNKWIQLVIGIIVVAIIATLFAKAVGASQDKIYWCHVEPNGNQQTLHLPLVAITQAGHANAQGNPLHAGDHIGPCVEPSTTPRITPSVVPSVTPSLSPKPTEKPECDEDECEPSVTPTVTPEPTAIPTDTPHQDVSDGRSDGLGCASHDCNTHPKDNYPNSTYDNSKVIWK